MSTRRPVSAFFLGLAATSLAACGSKTTSVEPAATAQDAGDATDAPRETAPSDDGATPDASVGDLPCDVDTVLGASCRSCHGATPTYGAPMPLVTRADLLAPATTDPSKKVYQLVGTRIHDDASPMPQKPNPRLDTAATKTLDDWIAAGAPAGAACVDAGAPKDAATDVPIGTLSCTPDLSLAPASPWTMPQSESDVYVCYGVDVPTNGSTQAIAFRPRIDNPKIVHHVLLYQANSSYGSTPKACSFGAVAQDKLVYAWAPGGEAFELPKDVGYPMSGTTHYVIQTHYNNIQGLAGETDSSGFDLCTTTTPRPNEADVLAFGTNSFTIPAHGALDTTCDLPGYFVTQTMHAISVFPHMHQLGTKIRTTVKHTDGTTEDLGGTDNWDFNNQLWYPLAVDINKGDTVSTRCAWANSGDKNVGFGENTADEMCFSFTMYWPKNPLVLSWILPSTLSPCHTTP